MISRRQQLLNEFESDIAQILVKLNFHTNYTLLSIARTLIQEKTNWLLPRNYDGYFPTADKYWDIKISDRIIWLAIEKHMQETLATLLPITEALLKEVEISESPMIEEKLISIYQIHLMEKLNKFGCEVTAQFFFKQIDIFLHSTEGLKFKELPSLSIQEIFQTTAINLIFNLFAQKNINEITIDNVKGIVREYTAQQHVDTMCLRDFQKLRECILTYHSTEEIQALAEEYKSASENKEDPIFVRAKEKRGNEMLRFLSVLKEMTDFDDPESVEEFQAHEARLEQLDKIVENELLEISEFYALLAAPIDEDNLAENYEALNKILDAK